ncbi:hypothetical protein JW964_23790 [candidate division KSB1 bacterium]|nr:hypothetical protein [candidate division KSB1 bacterium]
MKNILLYIFLILNLLVLSTTASEPSVPIMPLGEIRPGMRAVGRTVFSGMNIEEFELEIIEFYRNYIPKNDIILARLTSPNVLKTGVVSGMSGSPIYIDGKLIGALAYGFGMFTKDPIAGITPIGQMLDIFKREDVREQERHLIGTVLDSSFNLAFSVLSEPEKIDALLVNVFKQRFFRNSLPAGFSQIPISFQFSGFDNRVLNRFSEVFNQMGFQLVQGGSTSSRVSEISTATTPMLPGGALAGVLVEGDMGISGVGTITYLDGNNILAFGHPFLGSGAVNIPMAPAKVLTTIASSYSSYKMAEDGPIIGTIHQDRNSGIMGIIGETPDLIPIKLQYQSPFQDHFEYNFRIAADKSLNSLTPLILMITLYNAISSARMGDGQFDTHLSGKIELSDFDDIIFDNFYAGKNAGEDVELTARDVAVTSLYVLMNKFNTPKIERIDLNFQSQIGSNAAEIEQVWYDKSSIKPGESITLNVFIRPYLRQVQKQTYQIKLPETLEPGIYSLLVGSGDFISRLEVALSPGKFQPYNFPHLIKLLNQRRKNNQLFIQIRKPAAGTIIDDQEFSQLPPSVLSVMDSKKTSSRRNYIRDVPLLEQVKPVDWMLQGGHWIRIQVLKK